MAQSRSAPRLVAFILAAVFAVDTAAQTATASSTSSATTASSSTVASSSATTASTSSDIPLSLVSIAESLLSSYYPSTSLGASNIATLTFPSVVVIDSTTYTVDSSSTTTTSVLAEITDTADHATSSHHGLDSDAKIGIAVGCAVGGIVLVVLAIVFCCLYRRKRRTGAYFVRRPTPSVADSDMEAWRSPQRPEASLLSSGPSREWTEKYARESIRPSSAAAPQVAAQELMREPPMAMHPAFTRQHSHYSGHSSEDIHFYTPPEQRSEHYELEGKISAAPLHQEIDTEEFSRGRRSSGETGMAATRPPTPMNPFTAMMSGANQHPEAGARQDLNNPFMSPEDEEEEERDLVSPIIPTRSPERRHSPMVHYPSWGEVSEFDFSDNGGQRPLREQASHESSGDGWCPTRDSAYGRHEMP